MEYAGTANVNMEFCFGRTVIFRQFWYALEGTGKKPTLELIFLRHDLERPLGLVDDDPRDPEDSSVFALVDCEFDLLFKYARKALKIITSHDRAVEIRLEELRMDNSALQQSRRAGRRLWQIEQLGHVPHPQMVQRQK